MTLASPEDITREVLHALGAELEANVASLANGNLDVSAVICWVKKIDRLLSLVADANAAVYSGELLQCLYSVKQGCPLSENAYRALALLSDYCVYYHGANDQLSVAELNRLRLQNGKRGNGSLANSHNTEVSECLLNDTWRTSVAVDWLGAQLPELESLLVRYFDSRSNTAVAVEFAVRLQWKRVSTFFNFFDESSSIENSLPDREEALQSTVFMSQQLSIWRANLGGSIQGRHYASAQLALSNVALLKCLHKRFSELCDLFSASDCVRETMQSVDGKAVELTVIEHMCHAVRKTISFVSVAENVVPLLHGYLDLLSRTCWYWTATDTSIRNGSLPLVLLARLVVSVESCLAQVLVSICKVDDSFSVSLRSWESHLDTSLELASQVSSELFSPIAWYAEMDRELIAGEWSRESMAASRLLSILSDSLCAESIDEIFHACNRLQKLSALGNNRMLSQSLQEITILLTAVQEQRLFLDPKPKIILAEFVNVLRQDKKILEEISESAEKALMQIVARAKEWVWLAKYTALRQSDSEQEQSNSIDHGAGFITLNQWPKYLAENTRRIAIAAKTITECLCPSREFDALNTALVLELRVLWMGSQKLGVYRITQVSELLLRLHQNFSVVKDEKTYQACRALLLNAHRALRKSLNQAAARKRVTFTRDLLNELYCALDSQLPRQGVGDCEKTMHFAFSSEAAQRAVLIRRYSESFFTQYPHQSKPMRDFDATKMLLRELHTLKGSALMFGDNKLSTICHQYESLVLSWIDATPNSSCDSTDLALLKSKKTQVNALIEQLDKNVVLLRGKHSNTSPENTLFGKNKAVPADGAAIGNAAVSDYRVMELISKISADHAAMSHVMSSSNPYTSDTKISLLGSLLHEHHSSIVQLKQCMTLSAKKSFSSITSRLDTLVKMHSLSLDKEIHFVVENADIEVESSIVELLVAPLEHLLRNAVDHGIELPKDRLAIGKSERGVIRLRFAKVHKRELSVVVSDDGIGIAEQVQQNDCLEALCQLGFSTKSAVSMSSGHGLGLAAVKQALSYLRAKLTMTFTPQRGTSFRIVVPLS